MAYLYTFLKPNHAYYENWREMRRRRKHFWLAFLLAVPAVMGLGLVMFPIAVLMHAEVLILLGPLAWMVFLFYLQHRYISWPCPRCHRAFCRTWWGCFTMTDRCVHCDLLRYSPCDPAQQEWEFESHMGSASESGIH
jgi:hypothetical protein